MDNSKNVAGYVFSGLSFLTGGLATEEVVNIILLIVGIVSGIVSLSYTIYRWWKTAHADGKITVEELNDLHEKVKEETKKLEELKRK